MIPAAVVTPPAVEPVSLHDMKTHLRILHNDADDDIARLIVTARQHVEVTCSRALVEQVIEMALDGWPCDGRVRLPIRPVLSIESVSYIDTAGAQQTLPAAAYRLTGPELSILIPAYCMRWPAALTDVDCIRIRWRAGYADGAVPPPVNHAIKMLAAHYYENTEATAPVVLSEVPMAVRSLLSPYVVY